MSTSPGFLGEANVVSGRVHDGGIHTALGVLALQNGSASGAEGVAELDDRLAVAIVRPEQIQVAIRHEVGSGSVGSGSVGSGSVDSGSAAAGVAGRVQEIHYFGHDTIMLVRPVDGTDVLRVRTTGAGHVAAGAAVTLTARGPVPAFPATSPAGSAEISTRASDSDMATVDRPVRP